MNGPEIFLTNGALVHPRLRGTNLVTQYRLLKGYFDITNKAAYIYGDNLVKLLEAGYPGIRKMKVVSVFSFFYIILYISNYLSLFLKIIFG